MDWCFMCKRCGESTDHLLLHCEASKALWDEVFTKMGIALVMPRGRWIFLPVGVGFRATVISRLFGRWFFFVLCSVFGVRRMEVVSKIENTRWKRLKISFFMLCCVGLQLLFWMWLVLIFFMSFFTFNVWLGVVILNTSCVLGFCLISWINNILTYKKEIKKNKKKWV